MYKHITGIYFYGEESIKILLNVMENSREDLAVAVAGHKDRTGKFSLYTPGG